jgi:hypothetical protein
MSVEIRFDDKQVQALFKKFEGRLKNAKAELRAVASTIGFRDIIGHFKAEQGPNGPWPEWSESYKRFRAGAFKPSKRGRTVAKATGKKPVELGKKLVFTGHLRQNFLPSNVRDGLFESSVVMFNPVGYAGKHDRGEDGMPERKFMWFSANAMTTMARALLSRIMG